MEMIVTKEEVYTYRSPETGGTGCPAGPHGEAPGLFQEAERERGEHGPEALLGLSWEGMDKTVWMCWVSLALSSLNDFSRLWVTGTSLVVRVQVGGIVVWYAGI